MNFANPVMEAELLRGLCGNHAYVVAVGGRLSSRLESCVCKRHARHVREVAVRLQVHVSTAAGKVSFLDSRRSKLIFLPGSTTELVFASLVREKPALTGRRQVIATALFVFGNIRYLSVMMIIWWFAFH
jgi:hypothetical protein